ncbi:MAG: hypothetical protein LBK58_08135 [Prevotellaceae bacterium]|jgi:hypothetical protein|nr:hypothetical protein [Prevotellaceae bacterium]
MNEQVKQIVEKLTEKSRKGGAIWRKNNSEFDIILPSGVIFIEEDEDGHLNTTYGLYINNNKDECIYRHIVSEKKDRECFDLLRKLYYSARTAHYNAGQLYESMLKKIESADTIGRKDD